MPERGYLMAMPTNVDTGKVQGRFIVGVADGPDADDEPDAIPAQGTITFTASVPYLPDPTAAPAPATILKVPIVAVLDGAGYLCTPDPSDPSKPGARGIRLVATDDPDLSVQGWTWSVTYSFQTVNGVRPQIASHSMFLPSGATVDLTSVVKVPSSTGIGTEQAEALAASAQAAAVEASAAAVAASEAAQATDAGVAILVASGGATSAELDRIYQAHTSVTAHGAVGDGITDDSDAIEAALAEGAGGNVYFPPGTYRLTRNFDVAAGTTITGAGSAATLLDWSTKAAFDAGFFLSWDGGTFTGATVLAETTVPGHHAITVPEPHPFAVGDWVRVRADNIMWGEATPAEYQRVLTVDGGVLNLSGPVYGVYDPAQNGTVEKAHLATGGVQGLSIRGKGINPDGYGDTAIHAPLLRDFFVQDVHFDDVENKCILLNGVLGASVTDCFFRFDPSFTPLQYGVAITGACQMISVRGCSSWNDRHMVTTSTSKSLSSEYRGIPRHLTITGCTAHGSWQAPIDTHKGGEYITITGNALTSESVGVKVRGRRVVVSGNSIVGKRTSFGGGARGLYIGMVGEDVRVTGNMIAGFEDGVRFDTPDGATKNLVVSDNSIIECNRCIYVGATAAVNEVQITGNTLRAISGGEGVFFFAPATDVEVVANTIAGGHTGIFMSHPSNPVERLHVQGNTLRGQSTRAMFFRNLTDAFVSGNFSTTGEIRFTEAATRVTAANNFATVTDLTTGQTVTIQ